jgi:predicted acetylornithine/succinylornithine family transaminase
MNLIELEHAYTLPTYKRQHLVPVRAKDKYIWDDRGKRYLDLFSGISVANVGHSHPRVVAAIRRQTGRFLHVCNHYYSEPTVRLAAELIKTSFPGQVFLANSGAEANECAIKVARKAGYAAGRFEIISFLNSFHGRTLATLAATGQIKFHKGFEPLVPKFRFAPFNDLAAAKKLVTRKTAGIIVEPVQGEGGVCVASREFLKGLRALCDRHGIPLIFDEVQTGLGRTGTLFAYQQFGVRPDIMTLAKSLGGGLPIGATVVGKRFQHAFTYGDHGSTFGGNPVACAAAREVLKILSPAFLAKSRATGAYFRHELGELQRRHPCITEVRGMGLMLGMELDFPGKDIVQFCLERGLIINCTQDRVLRFLPPLTITRHDIDTALTILEDAFTWHRSRK